VIRNVCIHVTNEQPLLADLFALPSAADAGLVCTNVRMMDGKRPIFIDSSSATFFFPYHVIRFLEIPEGAAVAARTEAASRAPEAVRVAGEPDGDTPDAGPASLLPVVFAAAPAAGSADGHDGHDADLEIDEGFLQRIRDI
jgi:hypothetical protein